MRKLLIVTVLVFCGCFLNKETQTGERHIPNTATEQQFETSVDIDDNANYWPYQTNKQKYALVIKMALLGQGAVHFKFRDKSNADSVASDLAEQTIQISDCVDDHMWEYSIQYNGDIQIGSLIINCISRLGMF